MGGINGLQFVLILKELQLKIAVFKAQNLNRDKNVKSQSYESYQFVENCKLRCKNYQSLTNAQMPSVCSELCLWLDELYLQRPMYSFPYVPSRSLLYMLSTYA